MRRIQARLRGRDSSIIRTPATESTGHLTRLWSEPPNAKKPADHNRSAGSLVKLSLDRLRDLEIHVAIAVDLLAERNIDP